MKYLNYMYKYMAFVYILLSLCSIDILYPAKYPAKHPANRLRTQACAYNKRNKTPHRITIKPFAAYCPQIGLEAAITCQPFSMINMQVARDVAQNNPMSFLHILCPEVDLPPADGQYYNKVYQRAHAGLHKFVQNGLLVRDAKPAFYIYRQSSLRSSPYALRGYGGQDVASADRCTDGKNNGLQSSVAVIAEIHLDDYFLESIKPHELTKQKNERWLQGLLQKQQADVDPVMLFYKSSPVITTLIAHVMKASPEIDFIAQDLSRHSVWRVSDFNLIKKMKQSFARVKRLYIADGHHRMSVRSKMQQIGRIHQGNGYTGKESFNYILAALCTQDEMRVISYNRAVKSLYGVAPEKFLERLKSYFEIEKVSESVFAVPTRRNMFGMYCNGAWYSLLLKKSVLQKRKKSITSLTDELDASILYDLVLNHILPDSLPDSPTNKNTNDTRVSKVSGTEDNNIICIPGSLDIAEIEKKCALHDYAVVFIFYPVHINEIMNIVDAQKIMPPKTTFFMPKILAGLFVRLFNT